MKKFLFILTLLFLLFSQQVRASVPEAIKYQAIVRDNSGNVIANRTVSIRLSILKNNISGPVAYSETHAATTNSLGLINVEIGKGSPVSGVFSNISWNDDNYFIKIEVDENGGSNYNIAGVSQLVSVPYSLYAKKAGNGTQWSDTSNDIYYKTGNVGIGTANPKTSLEIKSSERRGSQILITGDSPVFRFGDTTYSNNGVTIGVAADSNDLIPRAGKGDLVFTNEAYGLGGGYVFGTGVPSEACVKITDDCKVGIGTDAPVSKLDVRGGDVNIEDIGSGVIMKSPDGNCWRMTVSNTGQPIITSINCLSVLQPTITPTQWSLRYSEGTGSSDIFYQPINFIKNGTASFGTLPHTNGHWFSVYTLPIPIEIDLNLDTDSLTIVANVRNPIGDDNANEIDLGINSDTACYATWQKGTTPAALYYSQINIGSQKITDISEHLNDPNTYGEYAFQIQNNKVNTYKNNILLKSISHTISRGGSVKNINIGFRGNGEIDWVKLYKGNKLIMTEEFNTNGTTTAVWTRP